MRFPLFLTLVLIAGPALAGPKPSNKPAAPKKAARTWSSMVDHVMANGGNDSEKAPASRTLGFDADTVPTKGLYIDQDDSPDKREHSISVVYDTIDGKLRPKEIVLERMKVLEKDKVQEIASNRIRVDLNGKAIQGMAADGVVGKVRQRPLAADSPEAKKFLADETSFWLKQVDLSKLKNDY